MMARRMRRMLALFGLVVAMVLAAPAASVSQAPEGPAAGASAAGAADATALSPLPPPGTERAYRHVFLAFAIALALILGYVVLLNRRLVTAERDLSRLLDRDA